MPYVLSFLFSLFLAVLLWKYNLLPLRASYYLSRARETVNSYTWAEYAEKTLSVPVSFRGENGIFLAERFIQLDKSGVPMNSSSTVASALAVARALDEETVRHPNNPLLGAWSGQIYMVLGEQIDPKYFVDAEKALIAARAVSPRKQEFLFYLGRLYLLKKDFPTALKYQQEAVAAAPDVNISHWFLGLTYVASGDLAQGLAEIEQTITLGFGLTLDQKMYIIDLYAQAKNYPKVIEWYQGLIKEDSENVNWYIKLATAYALEGKKAEALATVKQAVGLYPPLQPEADKFIKQYKLE